MRIETGTPTPNLNTVHRVYTDLKRYRDSQLFKHLLLREPKKGTPLILQRNLTNSAIGLYGTVQYQVIKLDGDRVYIAESLPTGQEQLYNPVAITLPLENSYPPVLTIQPQEVQTPNPLLRFGFSYTFNEPSEETEWLPWLQYLPDGPVPQKITFDQFARLQYRFNPS